MNGKNKDASVELLCEMYRNVTMGSENLSCVVPKIRDRHLMSNVTSQLEEYAVLAKKTERELRHHSVKPEEPSLMKKAMSRGGIALNTVFDSSDSHIAEMIERGTRMGMEKLEEKREELRKRGCSNEVFGLCGEIIEFEKRESDRIKDHI